MITRHCFLTHAERLLKLRHRLRPHPRRVQILSGLILILIVAGCSTLYRPEPSQLIDQSEAEKVYPLIVVPGVMGSQLVLAETGEAIWPPRFWSLVFGGWIDRVLELVGFVDSDQDNDRLTAGGLLVKAAGEDFYQRLLETLAGAGYTCVSADEIGPETDCVLFAWDWHGDLVRAAAKLDRLIERIRELRADSSLKVDIVAHSAGGMVARYFIRFGDRDVLDLDPARVEVDRSGANKVRKLALIGTPNYGSIFGLQRLMRGYELGLISIPPGLMAIMPSAYQLLPHPNRTWMIDRYGKRLDRDLYDPQIWRTYRESIFNPQIRRRIRNRFSSPQEAQAYLSGLGRFFARALRRGKRFHQVLSIPLRDMPNEYLVLGSDCFPTPAVCLLEKVNGEPKIRLHPDQVINRVAGVDYDRLMLEPGDGRVTRTSLLARDTLDPERPDNAFFRDGS